MVDIHQRIKGNYSLHSLWIKPTDALNSSFIGITTLHVSGSLSAHHQEFLAVHRLWYILCSCDDHLLPGVGWNSIDQSRCMAKNSWWWAERLPKTCRVVIPIKLEFSACVGFIHKESVKMHGHTIVKFIPSIFRVRRVYDSLHSTEDGGSRFLQNIDIHLPKYTALQRIHSHCCDKLNSHANSSHPAHIYHNISLEFLH
jgi:hypothetical protein